jgi:acyl-CoA synthetase (AMP-forming)/AMP-acid ligase II/pimeloyl-ACP methyl ester carboxylesterase
VVSESRYFIPEQHFPFASKYLNYKGFRLHYIDEECLDKNIQNPPVVILLHGNPTWCFFYREVISSLKSTHRVIAMDYIGCGLSDHPTSDHFRAKDRVAEVEFLYQSLNIKNFSIVMHDWGGAIGTSFLQKHLECVDKIVYLNTTLTEVESLPFMIKSAANALLGPLITKYTPQFLNYLTGPGAVTKLKPWVKAGYYYPYQTVARRTAIWDFVSDIPFSENHPTYSEMTSLAAGFAQMQDKPIKIIWGLKDPCFHPYMLRKVAAHFPNAHVVEVPNAGHLLIDDEPELVCREIKSFLESSDQNLAQNVKKNFSEVFHPASGINALFKNFLKNSESVDNLPAAIIPKVSGSFLQYRQVTFREIKARINQYSRGLAELGVTAGHRVLMLVPPGEDFLALTYAVMSRGAVPCFVDPGVGREKLFKCIKDCDPHVLIGTPKAHLLRLRGKRLFPSLFLSIWTSEVSAFGGVALNYFKRFSASEISPLESPYGIAMIAFTSGATGTPKGVIFSNEMIETQLEIFIKNFEFSAGEKDLPLLPIFSIFSSAMGVSSVFAPIDPARPLQLDPSIIIRIIQDLGVQSSFGSPTLWDKISEYGMRHAEKLVSIKRILMAGAPVSDLIFNRVSALIPNGHASTPYGATESLPVTQGIKDQIINYRDIRASAGEKGTPVGVPISQCQVRVIELAPAVVKDISETVALDAFCIGEIIVKGKHVSPAYLNRVDANLQGKIKDDQEFWHRIGDVGYLDNEGRIYYCGRKSHVVFSAERTYYPDPVENIFNDHPKVRRSALVSVGKGSAGYQIAGVAIEPIAGHFPKNSKQQSEFLEQLLELAKSDVVTSGIKNFYFIESFPVDARHNAKIFRDVLSEQITKNDFQRAA